MRVMLVVLSLTVTVTNCFDAHTYRTFYIISLERDQSLHQACACAAAVYVIGGRVPPNGKCTVILLPVQSCSNHPKPKHTP